MKTGKPSLKTVLVTGAGTGLGKATAIMLADKGWKVYGTIIPSQSSDNLTSHGITPLVVDVTDDESVMKAYRHIADEVGKDGLSALVNVAGLAEVAGGIIEGVSDDRMRALFEVNVFGTLRIIKTFLPLLREYGPARIVNVSSSGVRVPTSFSGIYAISKYAVEGITNAFRYELPIFGIQLTSIEPGAMDTPMTANSAENMKKTWKRMPDFVRELYYEKLKVPLGYMNSMLKNKNQPEDVARVIVKALYAKKMKIRYMGGKDVRIMPFLQRFLGENLFERMMLKVQKMPKPDLKK